MENKFDIKQIERDVAKVLRYSQSLTTDSMRGVPKIIDQWLGHKKDFIDHMGGNPIYQWPKPVSFELDKKAKQEKLNRFIQYVKDHYNNWGIFHFLSDLTLEEFYSNRTTMPHDIDHVVVPANFKTVKAFKFWETDPDRLKRMQNEASRIIQENVVSGYLCFSVHPLDYLSISENVHNWRSCHALDGEYRSGNLNYMVDDTTVVCYLRADKQAILPHFPEDVLWNSKKWRVLLFFSNDRTMIFAGRPYPFFADQGTDMIKDKLLPALNFGEWTPWHETMLSSYRDRLSGEKFLFDKMLPVGRELRLFEDLVQDAPDTYQFDDLLRSSVYQPRWAYRKRPNYWYSEEVGDTGYSDEKRTIVRVGQSCTCPICGSGTISYTDTMLCPECAEAQGYDDSDYYECEICGSMTHRDDLFNLEFSGLRVCQRCYDRETVSCQECEIRDMPDIVKYRAGDFRCLCPACFEDAQRRLNPPPRRIIF